MTTLVLALVMELNAAYFDLVMENPFISVQAVWSTLTLATFSRGQSGGDEWCGRWLVS